MRKILSSIMLIAVAAMASVSCQKEEAQAPVEPKSTTITLKADVVDTKTYITEGNAVLWGTGEYVQLYYNDGADKFAESSADAADLWDGESSAMFSFDITYDEADSYVLGGIYPASCVVESSNGNPSAYKVTLPAIQNASASSYDPKAFIMVMQPQTVTTFDTEAHLASFRRAVALNKVTLTGVKEDVSSVEITLPEGQYLAGRRYFDLTTGVEGEVYNSQTNTIKVNAEYTGSSIDVWFTSWGVELAEGDQVTIKMVSATKVYTRTISVNSNGLKFVEGGLNKLAVNMASAEEEVLDNLAGEYLIAAMPGAWVLMTETENTQYTNHYFECVSSEVTSAVADVLSSDFYGVDNIEDYVWVISEVDGGYAVQNKSTEKYLSWTSGNSAVYSETPVAFSVSINDDKSGSIVHLTTTDRSLQYNSGSPRFAFYTSTQKPLYFIPWVEDTTPRISVSTNSIEVDADATSCEFTYELRYVAGTPEVSVAADATMTEVDPSVEGNTVTVKFDANAEDAVKTATIVLSIDGADNVEVTITQKAYVDPSVIKELTVAEFLLKEVSTEVFYQLTGTIKNLTNTTYGNFDLVDETGSVYVYGLKENESAGNQTFANLGLKEGDLVTIIGPRSDYSGTAQVGTSSVKAYYVSHVPACAVPVITFTDNTVTITAETGATIHYTTDGTDPTESSDVYSGPIEVTEANSPMTVKSIAVAEGKVASLVTSKTCTYVDPNAGGGETVGTPSTTACYTLDTSDTSNKGTNNSYAGACDVTCNGITWNVTGNATINPWRIGGKNLTNVDRTVYSKTAYSVPLSKIEFVSGTMNLSSWNSLKLEYSTNSDFSDAVTITAPSVAASTTIEFAPEGGFPANCYFRFVLNVSAGTGSSNKYVQLSKIIFYGYEN